MYHAVKTALPANIEDQDLIDGQPLRPQPPHIRTGMSFHLARIKFTEISHRIIWQANTHSHTPYSFMYVFSFRLESDISADVLHSA